MRIATFDVGTNTVLASMVEGEGEGEGAPALIYDRARITRLGEGVDRTKALDPAALERTLHALSALAHEARREGASRLLGVGTSALRDALNRDAFVLPARALLDSFEVIDGPREAALTFRGAFFGLARPEESVTVIDIGGGSTEIVRGRGARVERAVSVDVGSVRLFERHLAGSDPPSAEGIASLRAAVDQALTGHEILPPLVMLAGTATNVAAVALGRDLAAGAATPHGEVVSRESLLRAIDRITTATRDERRAILGVEPGREDVIASGALLMERILLRTGGGAVLVSDGGVRLGLALEHLAPG